MPCLTKIINRFSGNMKMVVVRVGNQIVKNVPHLHFHFILNISKSQFPIIA